MRALDNCFYELSKSLKEYALVNVLSLISACIVFKIITNVSLPILYLFKRCIKLIPPRIYEAVIAVTPKRVMR